MLLLQRDGQLLGLPSMASNAAPRGTLLGVADGLTYLHLDGGQFLVTWPNGTEQSLDGVERLRAGVFACTVSGSSQLCLSHLQATCYAVAANATHHALVTIEPLQSPVSESCHLEFSHLQAMIWTRELTLLDVSMGKSVFRA